MKKLTTKQKKAVKWFVLILCFLWNTLYCVYEFFNTAVAEPFRYIYNDSIFSLGDTADYLFPDLEVWGWYVIVSSIVYLAVYIVYFVISYLIEHKMYGSTFRCKPIARNQCTQYVIKHTCLPIKIKLNVRCDNKSNKKHTETKQKQ